MRRRKFVIPIVAIAVFLAEAAIVPGVRADHIQPLYIGGVKLGMTRHKVHAVLGHPAWKSSRSYERQWHYRGRLTIGFERINSPKFRVYRVRTRSPHDRFLQGIHVGIREGGLRRRLQGETCEVVPYTSAPWPRGYVCSWSPPWISYPCGPALSFYMRHKHRRVKYIELTGVERTLSYGLRSAAIETLGCF